MFGLADGVVVVPECIPDAVDIEPPTIERFKDVVGVVLVFKLVDEVLILPPINCVTPVWEFGSCWTWGDVNCKSDNSCWCCGGG